MNRLLYFIVAGPDFWLKIFTGDRKRSYVYLRKHSNLQLRKPYLYFRKHCYLYRRKHSYLSSSESIVIYTSANILMYPSENIVIYSSKNLLIYSSENILIYISENILMYEVGSITNANGPISQQPRNIAQKFKKAAQTTFISCAEKKKFRLLACIVGCLHAFA